MPWWKGPPSFSFFCFKRLGRPSSTSANLDELTRRPTGIVDVRNIPCSSLIINFHSTPHFFIVYKYSIHCGRPENPCSSFLIPFPVKLTYSKFKFALDVFVRPNPPVNVPLARSYCLGMLLSPSLYIESITSLSITSHTSCGREHHDRIPKLIAIDLFNSI